MAGHSRGDMVNPLTDAQRRIMCCQIIGQVLEQCHTIHRAQQCRGGAHQHGRRAKAFDIKAKDAQFLGACLQPVTGRFIQFDDIGEQQPLRRHAILRCARA